MNRNEYLNILVNSNRAIKRNNEEMKEHLHNYYQTRKHKLNEFIKCSMCDKEYNYFSKSYHLKSHVKINK